MPERYSTTISTVHDKTANRIACFLSLLLLVPLMAAGQQRLAPEGSYTFGDILGIEVTEDRLYYGDGGILRIADISDPANPQELGSISTLGGIRRIITDEARGIAFVSYRAEKGFATYDVSDPANIELLANNYTQIPGTYNLSGDLFLLGRGGSVTVFDVSDPSDLGTTGSAQFSVEGDVIATSGNYAYVTGVRSSVADETYLIALDLSDPQNIQIGDSLALPTTTGIEGAVASGSLLYAVDGDGKVISVDISTPGQPVSSDELSLDGFPTSNVKVLDLEGDSLFVKLDLGNMALVDISDPAQLSLTWKRSAVASGFGEVDAEGNYLFNALGELGLDVYQLSSSGELSQVTTIASPFLNDLVVHNDLALGTSFPKNGRVQTLTALDISNPDSPALQQTFSIGTAGLSNMELVNGWAFFYNVERANVDAVNMTNPDDLTYNQGIIDGLRPKAAFGNYLVANFPDEDEGGIGGVEIWDLSTPSQPASVATIGVRGPEKTVVRGDSLYVFVDNISPSETGVRIYDISDFSSIQQVGFVDLSNYEFASSWEVKGHYLYVIDEPLVTLDISNPDNPTQVASLDIELLREAENTKISGNRLYVPTSRPYAFNTVRSPYPATVLEGMWEIDLSDPASPELIGVYGDFEATKEAYVSGDLIVLRNLEGITLTRQADQGPVAIESPDEIPSRITLKPNYPNPFNPSTQIPYTLPEAQNVTITVYNILGEKVATLVDGVQNAGRHTVTFNASNLSSGIYLYRLKTQQRTETRKMMLVK